MTISRPGETARKRLIGPRMRARIGAAVVAAMFVVVMAVPAQAHIFYVSCSPSYHPVTFSTATTTGTHTHSYQWVVNKPGWPADVQLGFAWTNIGARQGTASGPGTHNGWYQCWL